MVTKHQISGWRFLLRRIEHALVRRDASMVDDPQRGRSTALSIGIALACVAVAGAAVLAFFKPAKHVGSAKIVADKDSGALFVHLGDRLFPALNLTSARLIVGSAENPVPVSGDELKSYPRGPLVGIPGAPGSIVDRGGQDSSWAVCDAVQIGASAPINRETGLPTRAQSPVRTTAIHAPLTVDGESTRQLGENEARLLRDDNTTWLVYRSGSGVVRAAIDPGDSAVGLALGIDATAPVIPASKGLIGAIPEVAPLRVPRVPQAGSSVTLVTGLTVPIGAILTVSAPDRGASYYVVSESGVVQLSSVVAAMIRNADSQGIAGTRTVGPDVIASNLRPGIWPGTQNFPDRPLTIVDPAKSAVSCYHWSKTGTDANALTEMVVGRRLPLRDDEQTRPAPLVTAPTSGGATADAAYVPRDNGRFVQVTGADPVSPRRESLFWVSDSGVRYGIMTTGQGGTDPTLQALALQTPVLAPWSIVSLFAVGPSLSQSEAKIAHDAIAPDQAAVSLDGGRR
ncbi:type VII secretion protein EccB [Nocardia transvalensis]|uniref:Type VII secretion protein EccB n=1 Tax=Nocardia transvalensis TaxID=37333 RepID=A0A7W9UML5_9NOCA|nr:type VII secretion protein EccB [Nocardia transvalensis]MBB5918753.1 type VII secretion protein EccB [Nocardia transvalensis]